MDTGRLGIVRRQENSRRKFVFMLNDVMKSQYDVVDECLSREKFEIGVKYDKSFVSVRRAVVKQRVLQQCLRMKRESRKFGDRNLGVYGGKPLYTFSRDIDKFIADMHPRRRRLRQVEKALKEGIDRGKILDPKQIPTKIEHYFEKNWKDDNVEIKPKPKPVDTKEGKDIFKNTRNILPPLRGILNSYSRIKHNYTEGDTDGIGENNSQNTEKDEYSVLQEKSKGESKERLSDESTKHLPVAKNTEPLPTEEAKGQLSREPTRGLLILPPIQQTKLMAQR